MLSIEEYVVNSNPKGADDFLMKWGMSAPRDRTDFYEKVKYVLANGKEEAFADIAQVPTPYRDMILQFSKPIGKHDHGHSNAGGCGCSGVNGKSNCNGCGGKCGGSSNVEGEVATTSTSPSLKTDLTNIASITNDALLKTSNKISPYVPLLTTLALGAIFVAIVVKN